MNRTPSACGPDDKQALRGCGQPHPWRTPWVDREWVRKRPRWLRDSGGDTWGVEGRLHRRLDVNADADRSRVRHRDAAWIMAMFRGLGLSLLMRWRGQDRKRTQATLPDFPKEMGLKHQRRAFALVTARAPRALMAS